MKQNGNGTSKCMCPHCSGVKGIEVKVAQASQAVGSKPALHPPLGLFGDFVKQHIGGFTHKTNYMLGVRLLSNNNSENHQEPYWDLNSQSSVDKSEAPTLDQKAKNHLDPETIEGESKMTEQAGNEGAGQGGWLGSCLMWLFWGVSSCFMTSCLLSLLILVIVSVSLSAYLGLELSGVDVSVRPASVGPEMVMAAPTDMAVVVATATPQGVEPTASPTTPLPSHASKKSLTKSYGVPTNADGKDL